MVIGACCDGGLGVGVFGLGGDRVGDVDLEVVGGLRGHILFGVRPYSRSAGITARRGGSFSIVLSLSYSLLGRGRRCSEGV